MPVWMGLVHISLGVKYLSSFNDAELLYIAGNGPWYL